MEGQKPSFLKGRAFPKPDFRDIKEGSTVLPGRMISLKDFRKGRIAGRSSPTQPLNFSNRFIDLSKIAELPSTPKFIKSRSQLKSRLRSPGRIVSPTSSRTEACFEPLTMRGIVGKQLQASPRGKILIGIKSKLPFCDPQSGRTESRGKASRTLEKVSHLTILSVEYQGKDSPRQLYIPHAHIINE